LVGVFGSVDAGKATLIDNAYGGAFYTATEDAEATVTLDCGIRIIKGTGTHSTTLAGLWIDGMAGAGANYSIHTDTGMIVFGDSTFITTDNVPILQLDSNTTNYLQFSVYGGAPYFYGRRATGTKASHTAISGVGTAMSVFAGGGYDGSGWVEAGSMSVQLDGTVGTGIVPAKLVFNTRNSAGTYAERFTVRASGLVGMGQPSPTANLHVLATDAVTNTYTTVLKLGHNTTGTPLASYGTMMQFDLQDSTTINKTAAQSYVLWVVPTDASQTARRIEYIWDTAAREFMRAEASGSAAMIGFLGAAAIVRPSSTTDLRAALINLGLYTTGGATPLDLNGGALTAGITKTTGRQKAVTTVTDTYIALTTDDVIVCNKATAFTVTLPAATGTGQTYRIYNKGQGIATVTPNGTDTIKTGTSWPLSITEDVILTDIAAGAWG
jgi:hypothetical protein